MRVYLFTSPDSSQARRVDQFAAELASYQVDPIRVDDSSAEGTGLVELYDVVDRPAVVVTTDDGQMVQRWLRELPLAGDVSYWAHQ